MIVWWYRKCFPSHTINQSLDAHSSYFQQPLSPQVVQGGFRRDCMITSNTSYQIQVLIIYSQERTTVTFQFPRFMTMMLMIKSFGQQRFLLRHIQRRQKCLGVILGSLHISQRLFLCCSAAFREFLVDRFFV